ncbi:MAG TPA: response regulator [Armatimonadota bacterium]|nr:response regulator [Armatimonadota bacterium]
MRNTILIVDDQWSMQELARLVLEAAGYRVLVAGDAVTGLSLARTAAPSAIVLDALLPGAARLLAELCQGRATATLPVILITADVSGEALAREVARAKAKRLRKPFPAPRLLTVVNRAVRTLPMAG